MGHPREGSATHRVRDPESEVRGGRGQRGDRADRVLPPRRGTRDANLNAIGRRTKRNPREAFPDFMHPSAWKGHSPKKFAPGFGRWHHAWRWERLTPRIGREEGGA